MSILRVGSSGTQVSALQQRLETLGLDPGSTKGTFTALTEAAVKAFQRSRGLEDDGTVGPNTLAALKMPSVNSNVTLGIVSQMFPATPQVNIRFHVPFVLKALFQATLADKRMVLMALATIRAEAAGFQPVDEGVSEFNTTPGGRPFDRYDDRSDLGNQGAPDGDLYKGRGFIQLTGRANYREHGQRIGLGDQLVQDPELANDPEIAARLLVSFLSKQETRIRVALDANNLAEARRLVNGGSNGIGDFSGAYRIGKDVIPEQVTVQIA